MLKEVQVALVLASIGASISLTHKQANMEFRCMQFCRKLCRFIYIYIFTDTFDKCIAF